MRHLETIVGLIVDHPLIAGGLIVALLCFRRYLPWLGVASRVVDGDSLEWRNGRRLVRIRLAGIDAPEWKQPHGREAHAALSALVGGRLVLFVPVAIDNYNRTVCHVFAGLRPVSTSLLWNGHAWPDGLLATIISLFARVRRAGLWGTRKPVHPTVWRLASRTSPRMR